VKVGVFLIVAGYAYLIVQFGWVGVAAAATHIGALLITRR